MSEHITVRQYMTAMPQTIEEELELADAKARMFNLGVRHLPVVREGRLVGILSHRDVAVAESLATVNPAHIQVGMIMTPVPFTCGPDAHVEAVAREMAKHHYGSTIVVDPAHPSQVVGLFTTTDALQALADIIDHMKPAD
ncbi:MAG: CBS domain-containing protein [Deltaproteobacteria bacterium]|nr:CBS domain-containing protein [Deltaproteobacteria bacterium]